MEPDDMIEALDRQLDELRATFPGPEITEAELAFYTIAMSLTITVNVLIDVINQGHGLPNANVGLLATILAKNVEWAGLKKNTWEMMRSLGTM